MRKKLFLSLALVASIAAVSVHADEQWVTLNVSPGELQPKLREAVGLDVLSLERLKVTGRTDSLDLRNLGRFKHLRQLDLGELDIVERAVPQRMCELIDSLRTVVLPASVTKIGDYAFEGCYHLERVTFPAESQITEVGFSSFMWNYELEDLYIPKVSKVGGRAFYGCRKFDPSYMRGLSVVGNWNEFRQTGITEVPEGMIVSVPDGIMRAAFEGCTQLKSLYIPDGVTDICEIARGCTSLTSVRIPDSVTNAGYEAFSGTALEEIILPASVVETASSSFFDCPNLKRIVCKALLPPVMDRFKDKDGWFGSTDLRGIELIVSKAAYEHYAQSVTGWGQLKLGNPIDLSYDDIYVIEAKTLLLDPAHNEAFAPGAEMKITYDYDRGGQLLVDGPGTLHLSKLTVDRGEGDYDSNNWQTRQKVSLVNKSRYFTTDEVLYRAFYDQGNWQYVVMPFDVVPKDIQLREYSHITFRRYDGSERAAGNHNDVWKPVAPDEVIKAGEPVALYVINTEDTNDSYWGYSTEIVDLTANAEQNCNYVLKTDSQTYSVGHYDAEFAFDRSWNNLGNPYLCYYDIRAMFDQDGNQVTAPVYIWTGKDFTAYSPIDDVRSFAPYEGFFMQAPAGVNSVKFIPEGRYRYDEAAAKGLRAPSKANPLRNVFTFNLLSGDEAVNRARIVVNPDAELGYEPGRDAAKFFEGAGAKIFVSGDAEYEICERPVGDGTATLGVSAPEEGEFTLHLDGSFANGWTILLTDRLTGAVTDLTKNDYTFTAKAGNDSARFSVALRAMADDTEGWTIFNNENVGDIKIACEADPELATSVTKLRVTGPINWQDYDWIKKMKNTVKADFSGAMFDNNRLPSSLCYGFELLEEVQLPDALTVMYSSCFENCKSLTSFTCPSELVLLDYSCFSGCEKLAEVKFNDKLRYISGYCFYKTALTSVVLPESVTYIRDDAFNTRDSHSLVSIECRSAIPPVYNAVGWAGSTYSNDYELSYLQQVEVIVPASSLNAYRKHAGWGKHLSIKPKEMTFSKIVSDREGTLEITPEVASKFEKSPKLEVHATYSYSDYPSYDPYESRGELNLSGDAALNFGNVDFFMRHHYNHGASYYEDRPCVGSILNDNAALTADKMSVTMKVNPRYWQFITLPFDVNYDDIQLPEGNYLAVRTYDGKARAEGDLDNAWAKIEEGGTLKAGVGYAFYIHDCEPNRGLQVVTFPSASTKGSTMFATGEIKLDLAENPSEEEANRSWNLVGNPYPAYYDLSCLTDGEGNTLTVPVTYRNKSAYEVISPVDDVQIIYPFEPVFIQKPAKGDVVFTPEGRMHFTDAIQTTGKPGFPKPAQADPSRQLFNFEVKADGEMVNRARIVLNEGASMSYESARDAAKFFEKECDVPQLYVSADCRYAICERPLADGTAMLGLAAPAQGNYTLSLSGRYAQGWQVWLTDHATGTTVNLADTDYPFAVSGDDTARFSVRFDNSAVSGVETPVVVSDHIVVTDLTGLKVYEGPRAGFHAPVAGLYIISDGVTANKVFVNK